MSALSPTPVESAISSPSVAPPAATAIEHLFTPEERHEMIARQAYRRAEARGFVPGHELEDWLWAEKQVDRACGLKEPEPRWD